MDNDTHTDAKQQQAAKGSEEWKRIFTDIEKQVRREAARAVGTQEDATWSDIGKENR
jgi:hypothetical protein